MNLTKADLIQKVRAANPTMSKVQADDAVETFLYIIKSNLANKEDVLLSGFGKFCVHDKPACKGRNPQNGEPVIIDARRVVTFKPSEKLRKKVSGR